MRKAMVIDIDKCVGCLACIVACKVENDGEVGKFWNWVERVGPRGTYPNTEMYFLPKQCQHCDTPECIEVCPTGASYKRADGIVLVDTQKCISCESCIPACPYNARVMDSRSTFASKCTLCVQLTDKGEETNCVRNCPGKARFVGDVDDTESDIGRLLASVKPAELHKLKDVGNKPVGMYILRGKRAWTEDK